jgi:hypothetical protein
MRSRSAASATSSGVSEAGRRWIEAMAKARRFKAESSLRAQRSNPVYLSAKTWLAMTGKAAIELMY